MSSKVTFEDSYARKFDKYLSNCVIKMTRSKFVDKILNQPLPSGSGLAVGAVFSLVLFRRRAWPIVFGLGSGFGMATNDLAHDLNDLKN